MRIPARVAASFSAVLLIVLSLAGAVPAFAAASRTHRTARICRTHPRHAHCGPVARIASLSGSRPTVTLTGEPASSTQSTTATFSWQTTSSAPQMHCSLDGGGWTPCRPGRTYTDLSVGTHTFTVRIGVTGSPITAGARWTIVAPTAATGGGSTTTTPTTTTPTGGSTTTTPTGGSATTTTPSTGNSWGANIYGIATGSTLQNEDGTSALAQDLNLFTSAGAGWVRIDINWAQIQVGGPNSYNWTNIDDAVEAAEARGMSVLGTIVYSPNWAVPAGQNGTYSPNPTLYAAFAAKAAQHYAALGVQDFEIWNEPNSVGSWTPAPNAAAYTTLLKDAYASIKTVDPSATVITGGLSPAANDGTNIAPVTFLQEMYADGAQGSFDAIGMHPYCNPDLPGQADSWSAWYQMYGTSPSLRSVMVANGDGAKQIWGTEFGTPSSGASGLTNAFQAQTITQAYALWSTYSWAGPLFFYEGRDNGTNAGDAWDNYGFASVDFSLKPSFYAYQTAATGA